MTTRKLNIDTNPIFSDEAQEVFAEGCRIYTVLGPSSVRPVGEGAEGTYRGRIGRLAVVDFDTPSGEPFRLSLSFDSIRNLYR